MIFATSAALASTATRTTELKTTARLVPVLLAANVQQRQQCHKELQTDSLLCATDVRLDRRVPAASAARKTSSAIHLECSARIEFAKTANATEISTSWKRATATRSPENVSNASTTLKATTASNAWTVSTAIQALLQLNKLTEKAAQLVNATVTGRDLQLATRLRESASVFPALAATNATSVFRSILTSFQVLAVSSAAAIRSVPFLENAMYFRASASANLE